MEQEREEFMRHKEMFRTDQVIMIMMMTMMIMIIMIIMIIMMMMIMIIMMMVTAQVFPASAALARPKPSDIIQAATNVALAANKPASQAMVEAQQKTLAALVRHCNHFLLFIIITCFSLHLQFLKLSSMISSSKRPEQTLDQTRVSSQCQI